MKTVAVHSLAAFFVTYISLDMSEKSERNFFGEDGDLEYKDY